MKPVNKEVLIEASKRLMFRMSDEEYESLLKEFETIIKQIELISKVESVDSIEPMVFPYPIYSEELREDVIEEPLSRDEALGNAQDVVDGMVKVPKVVK